MIVKNESRVIRRCLESVKGLIDYWVIVDTGSTDGTQTIIKDFLADIPGELHERSWVNFAHNRNEALSLAKGKCDYFLFIDADDRLVYSPNFAMPDLDKDYYLILQQEKNPETPWTLNNYKPMLIKNLPAFQWEGALHEYLVTDQSQSSGLLNGVINEYLNDGCRASDPETLANDIQMLEIELEKDPENRRNVFYIAQTHVRAKNYAEALPYFVKRAEMGGWEEEVYWSLNMMGEIQEYLGQTENAIASYCKAYQFRPSRAESLFRVTEHFYRNELFLLAYAIAVIGIAIPLPKDTLFVKPEIYSHTFLCLFAESAFRIGKYKDAKEALQKILAKSDIPREKRASLEQNLASIEDFIRTKKTA